MLDKQEKLERIKEQNRKAVKKYREKTVSFAVKYSAVDAEEGKRLKAYLNFKLDRVQIVILKD